MTKTERRLLLLLADVTAMALSWRVEAMKERSRLSINKMRDPAMEQAQNALNGYIGELKKLIEKVRKG